MIVKARYNGARYQPWQAVQVEEGMLTIPIELIFPESGTFEF
jgi:hypothetical protein